MRITGWIDSLFQDVRYAWRGMLRSPTFTTVAVLTLAIGIGVNATVFTVTNAVLFKGFRLVDNDRMLYIGTRKDGRGCCVSYPDFVDWRAQTTAFEGLGAVADLQIVITGSDEGAEHADATRITANGFQLLGRRPAIGRDFVASDEAPGAPAVAILRYEFWERHYGRDPAVLGRTIRINGTPTTIVGVMPDGFSFPQNQDLWLPLVRSAQLENREARTLWFAFGRMAEGVTFEGARAELETIGRRLMATYPRSNQGWTPQPQTFAEFFVDRHAATIYGSMWGAVGFVLLIACANLANLALARAVRRSGELSVRMAIGASRWRIVRQLLVENLMLSAAGGAGGWWVAQWGVHLYAAAANPPTRAWSDHLIDYTMDGRVFAYLAAISGASALVFGLGPVIRLRKWDLHSTLKDGGRSAAGGSHETPLARGLVIVEMALAVVLLAGAGVMVRSFLHLASADLGVRTAGITTLLLSLPATEYRGTGQQVAFYDRVKTAFETTPGVQSVALGSALPAGGSRQVTYEVDGAVGADEWRRPAVATLTIGPEYFETLGARVVAGRDFNAFDVSSGAPVAIVNRQFAAAHWPGEDPVGKRLRVTGSATPDEWMTVVGVASDVAQNPADRQSRDPLVYVAFAQHPEPAMWVIVRSGLPMATLAPVFRRAIQALDPNLPIWLGPFTLQERLAGTGNYWRIGNTATLFVLFAAIALLLASLGLYAVVAQAVQRRTREIGIRIAIGATARDINALVFSHGLLPVAIGLAAGLIASLGVMPILKSQLVAVSPIDPLSLGLTLVILSAACVLGCWIPARRAIRVDPVVALRHD
jgi:putative ABC transport system permease protein